MPTLDEINAVAPDTPVFVMHLYDRALLNGAALRAVGYDKNAADFPVGEVQRDRHGNPHRQAERKYSLLHPGQGAQTFARGPA
jgi:predicted amidohydrolase YtcJ